MPEPHPLTISEVVPLAKGAGELAASCLEAPEAGSTSDAYALFIEGWVVGKQCGVAWLECRAPGLRPLPGQVALWRRDVAIAHPDLPWARQSGFQAAVNALRLPSSFEVELTVGLEDGTVVPFALVRGRRADLELGGHSGPLPLAITSLGRSGSTWLTDLLHHHPEIVSLAPYVYEPRAASYWMDVLGTLSDPRSWGQLLATDAVGQEWWTGNARRAQLPLGVDAEVEGWLGGPNVAELARFCKDRIDAFYRHVADLAERRQPVFFAEKFSPGSGTDGLLRNVYPRVGQIFLVRDFRDMACSVLAYCRQEDVVAFGRETVESDDDYLRGPLVEQARGILDSWRLHDEDSCLVKYEDLVRDARGALAGALSKLGLDDSEETVVRMISGAASGTRHQTAADAEASIGRWRRELSASQQRLLREELRDALEAFGYAADD